jgi:hypothetical protein
MSVYACPECGRAYDDPAMLAAAAPEEAEWYGRLHRRIAIDQGKHVAGYLWYCGCDAICFMAWGNAYLRHGLEGQPRALVVGRLKKREAGR